MYERIFEYLVNIFSKKGLASIMESQEGKTTPVNVPMSSRHLRSQRR